jgi:hypothetical protein
MRAVRTVQRSVHRGLPVFGIMTVLLAMAWVPSATAREPVQTCGVFHANALGRHQAWRAYKTGAVTCGAATAVLDAVLHNRGYRHIGSDWADSYILYHGWKCLLQQMGDQLCWRPPHGSYESLAHAAAGITAQDCGDPDHGCPPELPKDSPI